MFNNVSFNTFQWGDLINSIDNQCKVLEEVANTLEEIREELENLNDKLDKSNEEN